MLDNKAILNHNSLRNMGNSLTYRDQPLLDFQTEEGSNKEFKYAATSVTGWRNSQEDRMNCIVNYYQDLSFFAVYDGHGGHEIAEYLQKVFPNYLVNSLKYISDVELALQTTFLSFDANLREISQDELMAIVDDEEFVLPDRKKFIRELKDRCNPDVAGPSQEVLSAPAIDDPLFCEIKSQTLKFLTMSELANEDSDEDDMDYVDDSENGERSESTDSSMDDDGEIVSDSDNDCDREKYVTADKSANGPDAEKNIDSDNISLNKSIAVENERKDANGHGLEENKKEDALENDENIPEVGYDKGSTATMVLVSPKVVYIANVGDSRCVVSLNSKAFDATIDHKPTDKLEFERIEKCGSKVCDQERIDGGLNLSRAFGDFSYKSKRTSEVEQSVICDPHILHIPVTEELQFIVIASDGLWNSMNSQDAVDFIIIRLQDPKVDLQEICEELCRLVIAPNSDGDGSGCDNISLILILFIGKEYFIKNYQGSKDNKTRDSDRDKNTSTEANNFTLTSKSQNDFDDKQAGYSTLPPLKSKDVLAAEKEEMYDKFLNDLTSNIRQSNESFNGNVFDSMNLNSNNQNFEYNDENVQQPQIVPTLADVENTYVQYCNTLNNYLTHNILQQLVVSPEGKQFYTLFAEHFVKLPGFLSSFIKRNVFMKCCNHVCQNNAIPHMSASSVYDMSCGEMMDRLLLLSQQQIINHSQSSPLQSQQQNINPQGSSLQSQLPNIDPLQGSSLQSEQQNIDPFQGSSMQSHQQNVDLSQSSSYSKRSHRRQANRLLNKVKPGIKIPFVDLCDDSDSNSKFSAEESISKEAKGGVITSGQGMDPNIYQESLLQNVDSEDDCPIEAIPRTVTTGNVDYHSDTNQQVGDNLEQGSDILEQDIQKGNYNLGQGIQKGNDILDQDIHKGNDILDQNSHKGNDNLGQDVHKGSDNLGQGNHKGNDILDQDIRKGSDSLEKEEDYSVEIGQHDKYVEMESCSVEDNLCESEVSKIMLKGKRNNDDGQNDLEENKIKKPRKD